MGLTSVLSPFKFATSLNTTSVINPSLSCKMSVAKALSTRATAVITQGNRVVQVGYVDRTDQWKRIHMSEEVQRKFKEAAEQNMSSFRADTEVIALQETPHKSERDNRTHFTAVEVDGSGKVTAKRHFQVN